jgi:hypothetical protein
MSHVITLWAKGTAAAVDAPLLAFLILLAVAFRWRRSSRSWKSGARRGSRA